MVIEVKKTIERIQSFGLDIAFKSASGVKISLPFEVFPLKKSRRTAKIGLEEMLQEIDQ